MKKWWDMSYSNGICRLETSGLQLAASFSFSVRTDWYDQKPRKQPANFVAAKVSTPANAIGVALCL